MVKLGQEILDIHINRIYRYLSYNFYQISVDAALVVSS